MRLSYENINLARSIRIPVSYPLEYNDKRDEVEKFLMAFNLYVNDEESFGRGMLNALSHMEKYNLDFVDAITPQVMKK